VTLPSSCGQGLTGGRPPRHRYVFPSSDIASCRNPSTRHFDGGNPFWMGSNIAGQVKNKEQK